MATLPSGACFIHMLLLMCILMRSVTSDEGLCAGCVHGSGTMALCNPSDGDGGGNVKRKPGKV